MLSPSSLLLSPLSTLYGASVRARLALYKAGLLESHSLGAPVISVGNLTTGGTGKTPLVAWLAGSLAREGRRVSILTRGYGRRSGGVRVVVSDGERLLADAREGGDEPRMLAEMLLAERVAVVSDADRVAAARWALENLGSDAFIIDDGFQHLRLRRDLNLLTLDALAPWGGRRLLPRGRLREPLAQLRRADLIVITRADLSTNLDALLDEAMRLTGGRVPILTSRLRLTGLRPLRSPSSHETKEHDAAASVVVGGRERAQNFAAFCAIGNVEAFLAQLMRDDFSLVQTRAFRDHHAYTQADVDALSRQARAHGADALLTTAKDAVKLRALSFEFTCYVVETALEISEEARLREMVGRALESAARR